MEGLHTPHKVKSAVSGCPRNCAEAYVKDIGVVAVEGGWEIYVGGAAGAQRAQGRPAGDGRRRRGGASASRSRSCSTTASRASTSSAPTASSSGSGSRRSRRPCSTRERRAGALLRALRDRQGRRRPRPLARAPRPGPPQAVRRARHRGRLLRSDRRRDGRARCDRATGSASAAPADVPLLEGRAVTVGGRRVAIFRAARRLGGDRRRLPAPRRPAAGRPRRRQLRHLPAARPALRPAQRRAARRRATQVAVHEVRRARRRALAAGRRDGAGGVTRPSCSAPARSAPAAPTAAPAAGCIARGRRRAAAARQGRPAASGQPRRDLPQAAAAARGAHARPTARPSRCGATRSTSAGGPGRWRQTIPRAGAAADRRPASATAPTRSPSTSPASC